jgi:transcriptional regulator with XRE-family HTH domain
MNRRVVGDRFRKSREYHRWSQADLSRRTGIHVSAISHYETGLRMPCLANFVKLVLVLEESPGHLLGIE